MKNEIGLKKIIYVATFVVCFCFFGIIANFVNAATPIVSEVAVDAITHSTARITWKTNVAATGQIFFGLTTSYPYQTYKENSFATNRQWFLSGLAPNTTYNFCIKAQDSLGNISQCDGVSNNYTFTTTPLGSSSVPDPAAPILIDTSMPSQTGTTRNVDSACSNLQNQINSANLGDTIIIPAGTICNGNYIFPNKTTGSGWIIVRTSTPDLQLPPPGTRIAPANASLLATIRTNTTGPSYQSKPAIAFEDGAHHYRFIGIEITQAPTALAGDSDPASIYSLVSMYWPSIHDVVFDRVYVHGLDYPNRVVNAFYPFNGSRVAIIDSYISKINCWQNYNSLPSNGCGWEGSSAIHLDRGPGPIKISNNRIEGIGIAFFVNDDISSALPTDFEITNNYFYNDEKYREGSPSSDRHHYFNRQQLEFKKGLRILIQGNIFENNWSDTNMGYAIELVNHGTADSQVADVNINNNIIKNSAGGMTFNCHEVPAMNANTKPITRVKVANNLLSGIDGHRKVAIPGGFSGGANGVVFSLYGGCEDFNITHNTVYKNKGKVPAFLLSGYQWSSGLIMKDNLFWYNNDNNFGGIVAEGLGDQIPSVPSRRGKAVLDKYYLALPNTSWTFDHNVTVAGFNDSYFDTGQVDFTSITPDYPTGNYWVNNESLINFAAASSGNFTILNSAYKSIASDGTDPGINIATLNAATAGTLSGNPGVSNPPIDNTPPVIYGILVSGATSTSANVTWLTNENSDSLVEYGLTTSYGSTSGLASSLVSNHSVLLSSLSTQTTYHFRVKSRDNAGNLAVSADQVFTTGSVTPPPTPVSLTCPAAGNNTFTTCYYNGMSFDSLVATTSVPNINFDWGTGSPAPTVNADQFSSRFNGDFDFEAADYSFTVTSDDGVRLFVDGVAIVDKWIDQASITYTVNKTLTAGKHNVKLEFYENAWDAKIQLSWVKQNVIDSTPPVISNLSSSNITQTSATVSWATSELSTATLYYGTAFDNKTILSSSFVSNLSGLTPNTNYSYYVVAKDSTGNTATSSVQSFTTLAPVVDVTPPVISAVAAKPNKKILVISWVTDEPADTQVEYGLTNSLGNATPLIAVFSTTHSVSIKNLQVNTTYYFKVKSKDSSGNLASSNIYTIITKQGATPLPTGVSLGDTVQFAGDPTIYVAQEDGLYGFDSYQSFQNYAKASDTRDVKQQPTLDVSTKRDLVSNDILAKEVLDQQIVLASPVSSQPPVTVPSTSGVYKVGALVNDNGTIYLIIGQNKIPFTSLDVFNSLGYSLKNVIKGDTSNYILAQSYFLNSKTMAHPWSSWLKDGKTIYYSNERGLIPVPSMEILLSNGGILEYVIPMNQADREIPKLDIMNFEDQRVIR